MSTDVSPGLANLELGARRFLRVALEAAWSRRRRRPSAISFPWTRWKSPSLCGVPWTLSGHGSRDGMLAVALRSLPSRSSTVGANRPVAGRAWRTFHERHTAGRPA